MVPWQREKLAGFLNNAVRVSLEGMEDRTVPAYVPELGFGEADGYPLANPGLVTNSIDFTPSDPLQLTGDFYESVNAANAEGLILSGLNGAQLYNTEGAVITTGGGNINLGTGITYGRANSFTSTVTPGNEVLVNGGSSLGIYGVDAGINSLTFTVETGSQLLIGNPGDANPFNKLGGALSLAGEGIGATGVIQAVNGIGIASGNITLGGSIMAGASQNATLILNGAVNGVRSANAFDSVTITGTGTVILDNVFPVATVSTVTPGTTGNPLMTFRVTLSEAPQSDLTTNSLTVSNGTVTTVTKIDNLTYDFNVTSTIPGGQSGTVTAQVAANQILDQAYLGNQPSNIASVFLDRQAPSATGTFPNIGQSQASQTSASISINFTDGGGVGINPASILPSNLVVTDNNGNTLSVGANPSFNSQTGVATYSILPGTTWGVFSQGGPVTVTVSMSANSVTDNVGNAVPAGLVNTFIVNSTPLAITINNGLPIPAVNGNNVIPFKTSTTITSFDSNKFSATNGSIVGVNQIDATNFTVEVAAQPGAVQQIILLNIAQGALTDTFGNTSNAVTPSQSYTFDTLAPFAAVNNPTLNINAASATLNSFVDFNVFDPAFENILGSGVDISTILLSSIKVTDPNGNLLVVTDLFKDEFGGIATIPVSQFGGSWANAVQGTYNITIENYFDNAGNQATPTPIGSFVVGATVPTVNLSANPTSNIDGISTVTINFSTAANLPISGLSLTDFSVTGLLALSNLKQVGPNQYTIDVSPLTKNAAGTLTLPASSVTDSVGNPNAASNTLNLSFSLTAPLPAFSQLTGTPTNVTQVDGVVTFSEAVNLTSGLLKLSASDFNLPAGATFSATDTVDGINFPFSITLTNADQVAQFNVKAGIASAQVAPNPANTVGSPATITLVVSDPTAALAGPIAPINSTTDPNALIQFQVQFTSGLDIGLDFTNIGTALEITQGADTLTYTVDSINTETGLVTFLIDPPATGWTEPTAQGTWDISVVAGTITDNAGNPLPASSLGTFEVRTAQPNSSLSFPGGQDDYTLVWINGTSPNQIVVKVNPTDAAGGLLPTAELDSSIVPAVANFIAAGFNVVSVSPWQNLGSINDAHVLVTLEPITDVVGDTNSVGPASLVVKANTFFDIYGNGNSQVDPQGVLQNGFGFLSMVGIDRESPIYSTTGTTPSQLNGTQTQDSVEVRISFSDATSGVDLNTLSSLNVILTLGADTITNVATITGQVDPNNSDTYIYTLSPIGGTWADGTYTLRFTTVNADKVYDNAFNILFDPTSANGIPAGIVMNNGENVTFTVDSTNPTVDTASITPAGLTNVSPLQATVVFSEIVQGFTAGSLSLQGATLGSPITTNDGITYTFTLIPSSNQEQVSFTVLGNSGINDTFGNPVTADTQSNVVTYDAQGPTAVVTQAPVNINNATGGTNTNSFQVTFTDPAGVDPTSITVNNFLVDNGAAITAVQFDAQTGVATYTITAGGASWSASNQGTYLVTPTTNPADLPVDNLGNTAVLPSTSFNVDTALPTVTQIGFQGASPTNSQTLNVDIEFSKPVTFGDPGTDFVNLFVVTNGVVSGFQQTGPTTFTVTVNPVSEPQGVRDVTFQVKAGAATDSAGNPNEASSIASITFDNLGPQVTVTVQGLINGATNQQTVTVVVDVDPASAYNFFDQIVGGLVVGNATYVPGSFAPVAGVNNQYQFQITAINPGQVTVGIAADAFDDDLGNGNIQTTTNYIWAEALTVTVSSPDVPEGGTTDQSPLSFVATFNTAVVNFNPNDFFTLVNATVSNLQQTTPTTFTYDVIPTGNGLVSVQVKAGAATDAFGQQNQASTPYTFTFDQQQTVTATLVAQATPVTASKAIVVNLTFSQAVTGLDASNFVGKFTVGNATLDPNYFIASPDGTSYQVLLIPNSVSGSSAPVAVSLQFNANEVVPSNQVSNLVELTYINQAGVVGLGVGGAASLVRADGSILNVNAYPGFNGGVRVASANFPITESNALDLLTGAGPGGGPAVKVINGETGATTLAFFAFQQNFVGGVFVATGDVNADGFNDYVVSAGPGGGPHVKVFSGNPADLSNGVPGTLASFFAYESAFRGGSTVAVADINKDGFADVITGAGPGGGPRVIVFSGAALANNQTVQLASYFSGNPANTAGLFVAAGDLGGDGTINIITGTGAGVAPLVTVFTLLQQGTNDFYVVDTAATRTVQPYDSLFLGGVRVGVINSEQDQQGTLQLITAPGAGGGPNLKVFDPNNNFALVDSFFFPDDPNYTGGIFI